MNRQNTHSWSGLRRFVAILSFSFILPGTQCHAHRRRHTTALEYCLSSWAAMQCGEKFFIQMFFILRYIILLTQTFQVSPSICNSVTPHRCWMRPHCFLSIEFICVQYLRLSCEQAEARRTHFCHLVGALTRHYHAGHCQVRLIATHHPLSRSPNTSPMNANILR
jgi:hypothetical protein